MGLHPQRAARDLCVSASSLPAPTPPFPTADRSPAHSIRQLPHPTSLTLFCTSLPPSSSLSSLPLSLIRVSLSLTLLFLCLSVTVLHLLYLPHSGLPYSVHLPPPPPLACKNVRMRVQDYMCELHTLGAAVCMRAPITAGPSPSCYGSVCVVKGPECSVRALPASAVRGSYGHAHCVALPPGREHADLIPMTYLCV